MTTPHPAAALALWRLCPLLFALACSGGAAGGGGKGSAGPEDTSGASDSGASDSGASDSGASDSGPAPERPPRAVWVWHPPWEEPAPFVAALVAGGFTEAWLADYEPVDEHHALIGALHAAGIDAWALAGDPSWARGTAAMEHTTAIAAFNAGGEPYDGIQHDTEIHALPEFQTDPEGVTADFVATLGPARSAGGVPFMVATAVWLDPPLYAAIAGAVDATALMDYRDTVPRIVADAEEELLLSTPAWIGLELMEDPEGDSVSFHEEGKDALLAAMSAVEAEVGEAPGYAGLAVHDWAAWEAASAAGLARPPPRHLGAGRPRDHGEGRSGADLQAGPRPPRG